MIPHPVLPPGVAKTVKTGVLVLVGLAYVYWMALVITTKALPVWPLGVLFVAAFLLLFVKVYYADKQGLRSYVLVRSILYSLGIIATVALTVLWSWT